MKEELIKLINLQAIDSEIAGFDYAIANHQATIAKREQSIAEKQEAITAFRNKVELLNQKQRETKVEHEDAGARVKDRQNKMMQVQTSREHQALLKEIEENKRLAKETEERLLQFIEQIEQLEKEVEALENQCSGEQQLLTEALAAVDKEIKRIEGSKKIGLLQAGKGGLDPAGHPFQALHPAAGQARRPGGGAGQRKRLPGLSHDPAAAAGQ